MLRYKAIQNEHGIVIAFHELRQRLKALAAGCALVFIGLITTVFLPWHVAFGASARLSADFMIIFALPLCIAFFVIGCLVLHRNLLQRRFLFKCDGIRDLTSFPGISREGKWYPSAGIRGFGLDVDEHSEIPVLKFSSAGEKDWIILAERVNESEADGFIAFLAANECVYEDRP